MQSEKVIFESRCLSSLEKVFADEELQAASWKSASAMRGETYSFQVAYRSASTVRPLKIRIESELSSLVTVRSVGLVPSELPCYSGYDEQVLRVTPGLYPDPLYPISEKEFVSISGQWRSVWITVDLHEHTEPGQHEIKVVFEKHLGEILGKETFTLRVVDSQMPAQQLIHTEWFHADCLANYYGVEVFSEEHWRRIDQYIQTAVKHGINLILTPLFTPPLDTEVGGERPTVQLVDVEQISSGQYRFSFDRLQRWIQLCLDRGVQYFEFSHLFTQWGAGHAPKIMALKEGRFERIFGWETDAKGDEYKDFLHQFLPELVGFIRTHQLEKRSYFHVSDEPGFKHLDSYSSASAIVNEHLAEFPVMDALSDYSFYEQGLVKNPIPSLNHMEPFLEKQVPDLWTYYCSAQGREVSNRFFNMPSVRNRIIGIQLYKFNIQGFLHWGYNFWHTQFSIQSIDPFKVTDAGYAFPSGDSFLVYPGEEGPIESIRLEVFYEALQDMRALQALEDRIGRVRVLEILEKDLDEPITFKTYPTDPQWLLMKREQINRMIDEMSVN